MRVNAGVLASIFSRAMSLIGSALSTCAKWRRPATSTSMLSDRATRLCVVMRWPCFVMKKPEPMAPLFWACYAGQKSGDLLVDCLLLVGGEFAVHCSKVSAGGCVALLRGELQPLGGFLTVRVSQGRQSEVRHPAGTGRVRYLDRQQRGIVSARARSLLPRRDRWRA